MRLFVGLGNPGAKHAHNRHNIGFMAVDEIARRHGLAPWRRRFQGETAEGTLDGERVVLLKPLTFMNESGRAVREALEYSGLGLAELLVFHDEIELPPSKLRVKIGGSDAGHNGLRSISSHVGNDYKRVRLGVGHPRDWLGPGHPSLKDVVHRHGLADFAKSDRPWVESLCEAFVDIAGLVRGASKGEGLGNQFLATIREVDAIAHVVRCFEDSDITHVEGKIAPLADIETVETELMLADLESLEKRVDNLTKKAKGNDKDAREQLDLVNRALVLLREGKPARLLERKAEEERAFGMLGLLTSKPVLYVCNVEEASAARGNGFSRIVAERAKEEGAVAVIISAKIESEIATLSREERAEFLDTLGLEEAGLDPLIRAGYQLPDLITYFTVGPKEALAWG